MPDRRHLYQRIAPYYDLLDFFGEAMNQRRVRPQLLDGLSGRILDAGVGLHLAALDFDGDDSPELGVGGVLSVFRDYLQVGYGFDFSENRWYGFFGLGVPLSLLANGFE